MTSPHDTYNQQLESTYGLLVYGTVTVSSLGGLRLPFQYLGKPHLFHAALQRAVAQAKSPPRSAPKLAPAPQDDSRYMPKG